MKYDKEWLSLMEKDDSALTWLFAPMYEALENARNVCRHGYVRSALITRPTGNWVKWIAKSTTR